LDPSAAVFAQDAGSDRVGNPDSNPLHVKHCNHAHDLRTGVPSVHLCFKSRDMGRGSAKARRSQHRPPIPVTVRGGQDSRVHRMTFVYVHVLLFAQVHPSMVS